MTRRLLGILVVACAAALAGASSAGSAHSSVVAGSVVPLVLPPSQGVAIEAVTMRIPGSIRPSLTLAGTGFAPGATTMVAVSTASSGGSTTISLLAVTVSRETRRVGSAPLQLGVSKVQDSSVLLFGAPAPKPDRIWRLTASRGSAVGLVDTGATSATVGVAFERAVQKLMPGWNPLAKPELLNANGVQVRLYDLEHPRGRSAAGGPSVQAATSSDQLLKAPTLSVRDDVYEQIDETSGCILGRVRCGNYIFSFKGLRETIIRSDDPSFKLTTHYTGATCGRTMLGQPWKITTRSGSDRPVKRTVDLRKRNDVFTTVAKVKGVGSGTAIHKLGPQPGAFPAMQALVDSTGVWSSDAGGQTVPVSVTRLPAGKSC